jgi:hypothetical protein
MKPMRLGANGTTFVSVKPTVAVFLQTDTRPVLQDDGATAIQPQLHAHLVIRGRLIQPSLRPIHLNHAIASRRLGCESARRLIPDRLRRLTPPDKLQMFV